MDEENGITQCPSERGQSSPQYEELNHREGRGGGNPTVTDRSIEASQCDKDSNLVPAPPAPPTTHQNEYVEINQIRGGATNRVSDDGEGCEDTVMDASMVLLRTDL